MNPDMDKNNWPAVINSKAVTYLVLTLCVMVTAKFTLNIAKEAGIIPTNKPNK